MNLILWTKLIQLIAAGSLFCKVVAKVVLFVFLSNPSGVDQARDKELRG